ncbi:MAG: NADH-quinone oxidoreductase subunit L, partial [Firmicutes bacterium]|nr:NADH-quinone oxidoreductase subunit L [Bacillota bacterium]
GILAVLSVIGGALGGWLNHWLAPVFSLYPGAPYAALQTGPWWATVLTVGLALGAIGLAIRLYGVRHLSVAAGTTRGVGRGGAHAWYMDAVWTWIAVQPFKKMGQLFLQGEAGFLAGWNAGGRLMMDWADDLRQVQTGYIRRYALSILVGASALLAFYFFNG